MAKKIMKAYLNSSKSNMIDLGENNGLSGQALENFAYALYEVEFDLEVDDQTGDSKILKVDGRKVIWQYKMQLIYLLVTATS